MPRKTCRYVKYQLLLAQSKLWRKKGTGVQYSPENGHEPLLDESCNIEYGSATVAEVRFKHNKLANQLNKADLIKLAKARLIIDKNL